METTLKFPNKSHRKQINIPEESDSLAELLGIVMGDGGINNPWQLVITLNSIADKRYAGYVSGLLKELFKIEVAQRERPNQNALVLVCSSMNLLDFLVSKGAVRGNKISQGIDIPDWIRRKPEYEKAFVRGIMDTDGCIFTHNHKTNGYMYNHIGICFTSFSKNMIISVAAVMDSSGIKPHVSKNGRNVYLYGQKAVQKYLGVFGSSNPRISEKYSEWRGARVV